MAEDVLEPLGSTVVPAAADAAEPAIAKAHEFDSAPDMVPGGSDAPEAGTGGRPPRFVKEFSPEWIGCLVGLLVLFIPMGYVMGVTNMISTLMQTAYALLIDTCFYIMAIAVVCGALGALFTEFGIVALCNKIITPLMKPLFGMPGAASVGAIATFLSDNPAVCTFTKNREFMRYFKRYQIPALVNFGTCFGIGMIVVGAVLGLSGTNGVNTIPSVGVGVICAILGGAISTRLLLIPCAKKFGKDQDALDSYEVEGGQLVIPEGQRTIREGGPAMRAMSALIDGGRDGVQLGLAIIPGVLIVCTLVMMLTKGAGEGGVYTGAAYEGVYLLPWLASQIDFIITPLFGFAHMEAVGVIATALASAGASMSLVTDLLTNSLIGAKDIAVLTAICFCWSGFLSTHVPMLDDLKGTEFTGIAIATHCIGGLAAGIIANFACILIGIA